MKELEIIEKKRSIEIIEEADVLIYTQNGKENVEISHAGFFKEYILKKLELTSLKKYTVIAYLIPNGKYNIVTDHKKIWGQTNQKIGMYENSYFLDNGKLYLGITNEDIKFENINGLYSFFETYIPSKNNFPCEAVFDILSSEKCDIFSVEKNIDYIITKIQNIISDSIIILHTFDNSKIFTDSITINKLGLKQ